MIVKESNDTTRNFGIEFQIFKGRSTRRTGMFRKDSGLQQFKSKMDQLEERTSDREDVAQSKRRTNMIVELNDANALRDRSNTYKQVESAVDYMVRRRTILTPWVVGASPYHRAIS
jgi:hypothetical protein